MKRLTVIIAAASALGCGGGPECKPDGLYSVTAVERSSTCGDTNPSQSYSTVLRVSSVSSRTVQVEDTLSSFVRQGQLIDGTPCTFRLGASGSEYPIDVVMDLRDDQLSATETIIVIGDPQSGARAKCEYVSDWNGHKL